jgi:O-antigen ligase
MLDYRAYVLSFVFVVITGCIVLVVAATTAAQLKRGNFYFRVTRTHAQAFCSYAFAQMCSTTVYGATGLICNLSQTTVL